MKHVSFLYLLFFLVWGVSIVKGDLETGKIRNKDILTGFKVLFLFAAIFAFYTYLGLTGKSTDFLNPFFYTLYGVHLFWTLCAALALWYGEIWPAGDAKFFMFASASLPLINPFAKSFPNFLFLSLLINIFVVASFYTLLRYVSDGIHKAGPGDFFREEWKNLKTRMRSLVNTGVTERFAVMFYAVNLFFVFLLQQIFLLEARGVLERVVQRTELIYFFLFFLWDKIGDNFRSRKWFYISVGFFLLYFVAGYFLYQHRVTELTMTALKNVLRFSLILFFGRAMIEYVMEKKDTHFISRDEVVPNMIPSARTAKMLKNNPVFEGAFDDLFKDGFSPEQVEAVKDWLSRLGVKNPKLEIIKGRPFALWIFLGALISIIFDKHVLEIIVILP